MPGAVIAGDSGLYCCVCLFHMRHQLFERNYFPLYVDSSDRKLRQGKSQGTLFNVALAILVSWIVVLAGFRQVESHVVCVVVAALLHYFILASFTWLMMEGLLQYLLFVTAVRHYLLKTALFTWGECQYYSL